MMCVLLIAGSPSLRISFSAYLQAQHVVTHTARTITEGRELLDILNPTVVICDIDAEGDRIAELISAINSKHSGCMAISARDNIEIRLETLELGADDFVAIPFNFRETYLRVRNMLRKTHVNDETAPEDNGVTSQFLSNDLITTRTSEAPSNKDTFRRNATTADDAVSSYLGRNDFQSDFAANISTPYSDIPKRVIDLRGVRLELASCKIVGYDDVPRAELTKTESALLHLLTENAGHEVGKEALFAATQGRYKYQSKRALDLGVSRLRGKLSRSGAGVVIRSVRNGGYLLS